MLGLLRILRLLIGPVLMLLFLRRLYLLMKAQGRSFRFDWQNWLYQIFRPRASGGTAGRGQPGDFFRPASDPYEVLGLGLRASDEEIRSRYRHLAQQFHPDKFSSLQDEDFRNLAAHKFKQVQEAYEELRRRRGF